MVRLSIIIPFYNVEQYIAQCLDSVYNQDIPEEEYEVICVNDASPDNSREIVKQYQKQHSNLILVEHESNRKLGTARNSGLKLATGKYVWFVDSDDYLNPNCLSCLLNEAEKKNIDILLFDYQRVRNGCCQNFECPKIIDNSIITGEQLLQQSQSLWIECIPIAWNKLYLREFLIRNNFFFADDVMFEDTDWTFLLLEKAQRVYYKKYIAYIFRVNMSSITKTQPTPEKMVYTILQQNRCAIIAENTKSEIIRNIIEHMITSELTVLRTKIRSMNIKQKNKYRKSISSFNINNLKIFSTWRTWLAIRYGITLFIK